ncbi:uncharacterized protein [Apostichopus japonicus]
MQMCESHGAGRTMQLRCRVKRSFWPLKEAIHYSTNKVDKWGFSVQFIDDFIAVTSNEESDGDEDHVPVCKRRNTSKGRQAQQLMRVMEMKITVCPCFATVVKLQRVKK